MAAIFEANQTLSILTQNRTNLKVEILRVIKARMLPEAYEVLGYHKKEGLHVYSCTLRTSLDQKADIYEVRNGGRVFYFMIDRHRFNPTHVTTAPQSEIDAVSDTAWLSNKKFIVSESLLSVFAPPRAPSRFDALTWELAKKSV